FYVNCVGVQNNGKNFLTFDGGTTIYGEDGFPKILAKTPYEEELVSFLCDEHDFSRERVENTVQRIASARDEAAQQSLAQWL
ncbi:MAG: hypothetical protein MUO70_04820, partial [Euryarchaeota archaeon]|nr:hypothetical protein [Euryarchaeota archaeon]